MLVKGKAKGLNTTANIIKGRFTQAWATGQKPSPRKGSNHGLRRAMARWSSGSLQAPTTLLNPVGEWWKRVAGCYRGSLGESNERYYDVVRRWP